jgi:hypothetical protein
MWLAAVQQQQAVIAVCSPVTAASNDVSVVGARFRIV